MDIATGQPEQHPTPLPLDASQHPGVQAPTQRFPSGDMVQAAVSPAAAMFAEQAADGTAAAAAAMSAGMQADADRRAHLAADISPLGASYGDAVLLPPVPANAVPPASSALYPYQGDEPVGPAS